MPEGDSLRSVARRLAPLVGERVEACSPHPRAAALGIAPRLDGSTIVGVEARGKNLLIRFDGGEVLRSHLMMRGRWIVRRPGGRPDVTRPWLILRTASLEAVLFHGPVLELGAGAAARLGPDVMADPPDVAGMVARLRHLDPATPIAVALLDQRAVSGIGNVWRSEALHACSVSPLAALRTIDDVGLASLLERTGELMRAGRLPAAVYRRTGRPCRRCAAPIVVRRLGESARAAYWCPSCQAGVGPPST